VLIHEAIGDQLTCVFVDHGLMRLGESEQVVSLFRGHYNIPLVHVDASTLFLNGLAGPHRPRGQAQVHRQDLHRRVRGRGDQDRRRRVPRPGTLYPDVIESVSFTGGPA
jgi:GMP synthase (glutamine-hydrolysing)